MAGGAVSRSAVVSAVQDLLTVARHNDYRRDDLVALIDQMG